MPHSVTRALATSDFGFLLHMHRLAEIADDPFGAQAAGFILIRIAALALQHLVILHGHATAANPVVSVS